MLLFFPLQAGLLGCEAVLSSMALMQASSMAAPPKKMMAPLGHGPPQREGPDRGPQSHMILPSGMSCPPLVRTHLGQMLYFNHCVEPKPISLMELKFFQCGWMFPSKCTYDDLLYKNKTLHFFFYWCLIGI